MMTEEVTEVTKEAAKDVNQLVQYAKDHVPDFIGFGIKIGLAVLTFFIGRFIITWIRKVIRRGFERSNADKGVRQFTDSIIKCGLYAILAFLIATSFGVNISSLATILAAAGVAISLALQGVISNFAGGVLILTLRPFVVGDYIIEDNNGNEGTVKEIQLFHTKLTTIDNKTIVIPNGMLTNNSLTNVTEKDERRLDLKIDISYNADLKKAKDLILDLLHADADILHDKEILVFVDELGQSSVVIGVRAWVGMDEYWPVRWRILEEIKLLLDQNHIEIPYQQMKIHLADEKTV